MMEQNDFNAVPWHNDPESDAERPASAVSTGTEGHGDSSHDPHGKRRMSAAEEQEQQSDHAQARDPTGLGEGTLECTVDKPQKENDGTKDAFVSYLVTTHTDFKSFQRADFTARRRFTDFLFLYKTLCREYPASAVPPLPDKHKMEYVRGDRFGPDFTQRRAYSLHRFLKRLTLHPVLRRSSILIIFLESSEWNAHMRIRPTRGSSISEQGGGGVFDNFTDTFLNAFSKVHKPDKRFIEVRERADKLDDDLGHVEKIMARVARRTGDLEADYADLGTQFHKLVNLEPGVQGPLQLFAANVEESSGGFKELKEHMDQNYLGSLRDMEAYIVSIKSLLKVREQKQLDFEGLTDYLNKAASDRDTLASSHGSSGLGGPGGFLRSKIEDVRGVDHEQARRERVRKLELQIEKLSREVEDAKRTTEAFDEEVVREVADFERIKASEFQDTLGDLADAHINFYSGTIDTWERFLKDIERDGVSVS
ncbi:vacuolar targeting protein Atg24 [Xylona heveae TC161]|uniref:Sorting nexin-4 n=1 Tax=Xylona heveae (strain CBS 132557 / TC161) TaxID=1328760 RepID=A0A165J9D2_XYLHT|nr:vacuolar targeting protein Atg24 [Xylona heveae TC161]KZF25927.1 vacuolar targeting protein Atg24 [Xylona heveae TC161]